MTLFEEFVNSELPKRIGTNSDPTKIEAGSVPISTGVGLLTEFVPVEDITEMLYITAPRDIGGHRVVTVDGDYADSTILGHAYIIAGITTGATSNGAVMQVRYSGEIIEDTWNWTEGLVFLGTNGLLTQTAPTTGFMVVIGVAKNKTTLLVRIQQPIILI